MLEINRKSNATRVVANAVQMPSAEKERMAFTSCVVFSHESWNYKGNKLVVDLN